jgi:hypothetical protein
MTIKKTAVLGELLVSCGILTEKERVLAVGREREFVINNISEPEKSAFIKACESNPEHTLTAYDLAKQAKFDPNKLPDETPRFTAAAEQLIKEGIITSVNRDQFKTLCELLSALQAIGRAEGIIATFQDKGIAKDKLRAIQETYSSAAAAGLNDLRPEPFIAKSPFKVTKESQAVTGMLKCFVDVAALAMDENPKVCKMPTVKKAVDAAAALQYLLKKELLEELKKTGKAPDAIEDLSKELKEVKLSEIGEKKGFLYNLLCQGVSFVVRTAGLQCWGQKIADSGYKTDTTSYVESIAKGTRTVIDNVSAADGSNSGKPIWYDKAMDWLKDRAEWAGLGKNTAEAIFKTEVSSKAR